MASPPPVIPPPTNVSPKPDKATKQGLDDYTSDNAAKRVLLIHLGFFRYGTTDQSHAAAIVLSLIQFVALMILLLWGGESQRITEAIAFLEHSLPLTIGVAIGQRPKGE